MIASQSRPLQKRLDRRTPEWAIRPGITLVCAILSGIAAAICLAVPHEGAFAALWVPNALIVGIALSLRRIDFPYVVAGTALGVLFGELSGDLGIVMGSALTVANVVEIVTVVLLTRRWCGTTLDFTDPRAFFLFVGANLTGAMLSTGLALAAMVFLAGQPQDVERLGALFFARHAGSLLFVAPLTMVAIAAWRNRDRGGEIVPLPIFAIVLGCSIMIFAQTSFPFLFLVTPLVVLAGISSGIGGNAFVMIAIACVAAIATASGSGPIVLTRGGAAMELVSLQLFLASLTVVGLPLAGLIERGRRDSAALRASRDEKRDLLDNIDEVIFSIDDAGCWKSLNRRWEKLTGLSRAESLGERFDAFLPVAERERIAAAVASLMAGQAPLADCEVRFDHTNGEVRHVDIRMMLAHDDSGAPTGIVGRMLDVTEKVARRRALETSERQFASLAELAPAGLYRTDAMGRCTWVNRAWVEITGLTDCRWQGTGWADAIHPDDAERVFHAWNDAVAARSRFVDEWRWLRPDGTISWVRSAGAPHFDAEGQLAGFIGINMDITANRHAEAELAERDKRIKTITDNVRDALFMIAPDGSCSYASPYAVRLCGLDPKELPGRPFAALFGRKAAAGLTGRLQPLWAGRERTCELQFRMESDIGGDGVWLDAQFAVVDDGDRVSAVVASLRDITDAKQLEEELTVARRKAEHAARAKAMFLANMSHEIRTPMNGVLGFAELLLDSKLTETQRRQTRLIVESGQAMMRLLNDILDMSKIESGNMTMAWGPVDIRAKLDNCTQLLTPVAESAGIELRQAIDDAVPRLVMADALRLRQILLNLIGNALKFTEHGTVSVWARVEHGDVLAIDVTDTGIGIAEDRVDAIFGQFQQADNSVGRKYGGTGLGLAISNSLARLMGGEIAVRSALGVGTTFTLRIPLTPAASGDVQGVSGNDGGLLRPSATMLPAAMPQLACTTGESPPRVLIAEDNDINQELVLAMARRAGLDPDLANDGAEAVRMVQLADHSGQPYRLVLMDMQMPEVDGLEATRRLRAAGFAPDALPIIALTANCFSEDIAACRAAGMQEHLAKPLQMQALNDVLDRHLRHDGPKQPVHIAPDELLSPQQGEDGLAVRYRHRKEGLLRDLADVASGKADPQWDVLAMQLHKLAGTAGYFGEAQLGELARGLEDRLRKSDDCAARQAAVREEWERLRVAG